MSQEPESGFFRRLFTRGKKSAGADKNGSPIDPMAGMGGGDDGDDGDVGTADIFSQAHSAGAGSQSSVSIQSSVIRSTSESINKVLWWSALPYLLSNLVAGLSTFLDYGLVLSYAGVLGARGQAIMYPFEMVLCRDLLGAILKSGASFVLNSLSRSKTRTANRIFNLVVCFSLCFCVLICALFAGLSGVIASSVSRSGMPVGDDGLAYGVSGTYLILYFTLGSFGSLFAEATGHMLAIENRTFLNTARQLVCALLSLVLEYLCFHIFSQARNRDPSLMEASPRVVGLVISLSAAGTVGALICVSVWMLLVFCHVTVMGMPVKSCLRLSFTRKMFRLPAKAYLTLLARFLANYLSTSATSFMVLACNLLLASAYSSAQHAACQQACLLAYARFSSFFNSVNRAFNDSFQSAATFNMNVRLYGRVKALLNTSVLWMLLLSVCLCVLGFFFSSELAAVVLPPESVLLQYSDRNDLNYFESRLTQWISAAAISPLLHGAFLISCSMAEQEGKYILAYILHAARILLPIIMILIFVSNQKDEVDLCTVFIMSEITVGIMGMIYVIYYIYKYNYLAEVEQHRQERQNLEAQLETLGLEHAEGQESPEGEVQGT